MEKVKLITSLMVCENVVIVGDKMKLKYLSILIALFILGGCAPTESVYPFTTIGSVLQDPETFAGRRIRLSGTYQRDPRLEPHEIQGILQQEGNEIPVRGKVLDWIPPERTTLQLWGEIILENSQPVLLFHNGRGLGNIFRHPKPLPSLETGDRIQVKGRLEYRDNFLVLISEDLNRLNLTNVTIPDELPALAEIDGEITGKNKEGFTYIISVEKMNTHPYPPSN